jgi:virginiamycin B lyase
MGTGEIGAFSPTQPGSVTYYSSGLPVKSVPWGIVSGPDQNLWFTDTGANAIGRITVTGSITEFSGVSTGGQPWNIIQAPSNNAGLMFTELEGNRIGFIGISGIAISSIMEESLTTETGSYPWGISLYTTTGAQTTQTVCYTASGGSVVGCFAGGMSVAPTLYPPSNVSSPAAEPYGMTQGPGGALWIADYGQSCIATFTPGGAGGMTPVTTATPTHNAGPYQITPGPSAAGGAGTLWFTEYTAGQIGRVTVDADKPTTISEYVVGNGTEPAGIVVQSNGTVWFTAYEGGFIGELQPGATPG